MDGLSGYEEGGGGKGEGGNEGRERQGDRGNKEEERQRSEYGWQWLLKNDTK